MRPLLTCLLCAALLSACTFSIAAPPPTPTPPPQEFAELLYRALSFQALTRDAFAIGAQGFNGGTMDGTDAMSMALLTIGLLQGSGAALQRDYPPIFADNVTAAKQQHDALRGIGDRWIQKGTLTAADVPGELAAIDANESLRLYADWLIAHGYTYDDVEMMDVRFRADIKQATTATAPH